MLKIKLQKQDIQRLRIQKTGLITPFPSIEECVSSLFGIQSQVQQFGEISIMNRVNGVIPETLKNLYKDHRLIKIWGQRMTVHMYTLADWKNVHQVFAHRNNFVKKGWQDKSPNLEQMLASINALTQKGKSTKKEITDMIESMAAHISDPYRDYSLFLHACLDGIFFGMPQMPQTNTYVHRSVCVDEDEFTTWQTDKAKALEYLLLNYFKHYGPATVADFCHWSGLTKREAQTAFDAVEEQLIALPFNDKTYYLLHDDPALSSIGSAEQNQIVKLLGKFDPLFVSFSDKTWIADAKQQKAIWRPAAHIEAVLLVNDEALGTWRYVIKGNNIDFVIILFKTIPAKTKKQVEKEAQKIAAFLMKKLNKVIYS